MMSAAQHHDMMDAYHYILKALLEAMEYRWKYATPEGWVANERERIAWAANYWSESWGNGTTITVADVERLEGPALGHTDFASKLSLYVARFILELEQ